MNDILPIIMILAWASSKYVIALGFIFYYDYGFWGSLGLAIAGGMIGVLFFSFLNEQLRALYRHFFPKKEKAHSLTFKQRLIQQVRQKFGLAGIAFLTPVILTVPVGTMVAASLYHNKPRIFAYMFVAFSFWSLLFCGLYYGLNIDLAGLVH